MERGQFGVVGRVATIFVFDDLIAHLVHPRAESIALKLRQWDIALDSWEFDQRVCDYINSLVSRYDIPVEVVTWRPTGFAHALHDRFAEMDVFVSETTSSKYEILSPRYATDQNVGIVYDADHAHQFGYGFKSRDFLQRTF